MERVVVGVCLVRNCWKLFNEPEATLTFLEREDAVEAARTAARRALAEGKAVDLYLEDGNGDFQRPALASIGH